MDRKNYFKFVVTNCQRNSRRCARVLVVFCFRNRIYVIISYAKPTKRNSIIIIKRRIHSIRLTKSNAKITALSEAEIKYASEESKRHMLFDATIWRSCTHIYCGPFHTKMAWRSIGHSERGKRHVRQSFIIFNGDESFEFIKIRCYDSTLGSRTPFRFFSQNFRRSEPHKTQNRTERKKERERMGKLCELFPFQLVHILF